MPTRIVAGPGSLATIGTLARDLKMSRALVVSDPVISQQPFHRTALDALQDAGLQVARFDECGIDARCSHIDDQGERVRREGIDGVICIGGGSVMCTGKGIAIVATNNKPMRDCAGVGKFDRKALPMIMVPTTAGSGSEVSQWTIVKDEERHLKLLGGGPLSFPNAAILDPATLRSLPMRVAALPAVDALTHGVEAYFSGIASPLTDAIALSAVRLQYGSLRASINSDDERAREANLLASCMANIACGNARLGHGHALSLPLEGRLDLPHPYGVGVLLPHVVAFNLPVLPEKTKPLAEALEVETAGLTRAEIIEACADSIRSLYADIGFPDRFTPDQLPSQRVREMAARAVPGLYAGIGAEGFDPASANDYCDTLLILREIDRRHPEPTLYPGGQRGLVHALSAWWDRATFFPAAKLATSIIGDQIPADFIEERRTLMNQDFTREASLKELPLNRQRMHVAMAWLADMLKDRPFILGQQPSAADLTAYHTLWFAQKNGGAEAEAMLPLGPLHGWMDRIAALGHGCRHEMPPGQAPDVARDATPEAPLVRADADPSGLRPGQHVVVRADDYGREPVRGLLVAADAEEVIIRHENERVGVVHIHFPRAGYEVLADTAARQE